MDKKSIGTLVNEGVLPPLSFFSEAEIVKICKSIGIPATDKTFELDKDQMDRLLNDATMQIAIRNNKYRNTYKIKYTEYQSLVDKYENMKSTKGHLLKPEELNKIDELINKLKAERGKYAKLHNNIKYDSVDIHFKMNKDPIAKSLAEAHGVKVNKINEKLKTEYEKLDDLISDRKNAKSKFKQAKIDKKIKKLNDKIKELRTKQGVIIDKQEKLINKNAKKFVSKMKERQNAFKEQQAYIDEQINRIEEYTNEANKVSQEIFDLEDDISNTSTATLRGKLDNMALKNQLHQKEMKLNELRKKIGTCDRRIQHKKSFGKRL